MPLIDHGPLQCSPLHQFGSFEALGADCCQARAENDIGEQQPPCQSRWAMSFLWRSAFDGGAVAHVARNGDSVGLCSWIWRSRLGSRAPLPHRALAPAEWERLQEAFKVSGFWSLDAFDDDHIGLDGATWVIEARSGDTFRTIQRWCPRGAICDLGRFIFALAGAPLANIDLY
jgi:hypothetical protein